MSDSELRRPWHTCMRLLTCVRFDEVCVLQGAPFLGACFSVGRLSMPNLLAIAVIVAANSFLVAHVFVLNDWSGIVGDARDPRRVARTFLAKGAGSGEMLGLALALAAFSLVLFGLLGPRVVALALAIVGLSALYSAPAIQGKGVPIFNSALHFVGGTLHFLLGYAVFAPISLAAIGLGCFFGLSFAAGHLTHEARDCDADRLNGIRTNAVAFGVRFNFFASAALFGVAYALLTTLAIVGAAPFPLVFVAVLYPLHLLAAWRALRSGLTYDSLRRLQSRYRSIHATIGLAMLATAAPW